MNIAVRMLSHDRASGADLALEARQASAIRSWFIGSSRRVSTDLEQLFLAAEVIVDGGQVDARPAR